MLAPLFTTTPSVVSRVICPVDEIVRDKVGGAITKSSYKQTYITALKYKEMVDAVVKEMEGKNE